MKARYDPSESEMTFLMNLRESESKVRFVGVLGRSLGRSCSCDSHLLSTKRFRLLTHNEGLGGNFDRWPSACEPKATDD
uniref:Uncharacterized protein n=1 Tax=Steinernema glaseri TaxID=37863 RepID=A0A1I7Y2J8_9BILA